MADHTPRPDEIERDSSNHPYGDGDYGMPERASGEFGRDTYGGRHGRERYGAREWSSTEGWRVPGPRAGRRPPRT